MIRYLFFFTLISILSSCKESEPVAINKFADTVITKIADFKDCRLADSLLPYLKNSNASYRREAALAFASVQDSNYVENIGTLLLTDQDSSVRKAAAFSLGQTPSDKSEIFLHQAFLSDKSTDALIEIIEAYGKVAKAWKLDLHSTESAITTAFAWSYYRMGLRGLGDEILNGKAIELLNSTQDESTKLGLVHYFARGATGFDQYENVLIQFAKQDSSPEVRMGATLSLRKLKSDSSRKAAQAIFRHDPDYRVRINALRVLQIFPFPQTKEILIEGLQDSVLNVGIAASEVIKASVTKEFWRELSTIARTTNHWLIQANLYQTALSVFDHKELAEEIRTAYNNSTSTYKKAALLTALQHSIMSYEFVQEKLFERNEPVIKLAAASSLVAMNYRKNFLASLKPRFAEIYKKAIEAGDVGVIGTVSNALSDSTLNYKSVISDFSFLHAARNKLSLPKDFEAIGPLEAAITYFEGNKPDAPLKNVFNHPIPWDLVKKIPRDQNALIKTSKGTITIRLFVEEAPGSVANFMTLASEKYYDKILFHRVVPNFVVQAGCNRGDGLGSEDYSLRSEFSYRRYKTGSLGMASAGKDTEGTQWFITHSPTPHLDGRYTIFGEVEDGMEVVNKLEVEDTIASVEIINFEPL